MSTQGPNLLERITAGKLIRLAELTPPRGGNPDPLRAAAQRYRGKVHAVGLTDNRERVAMAALAAASVVAAEGLEPVLHIITRDRNRVALVSEVCGAQALGIRNLLCTSGAHQTLGRFRAARNVYDMDTIQLLQTYANLASDGALVGETGLTNVGPFCLGAVASPEAEPPALQWMRLAKKIRAGAQFLITQPVFDVERFGAWWQELTRRGLHEQAAIVAGIQPLTSGLLAPEHAGRRPLSRIPDALVARVTSKPDMAGRRAAAIEIALETIGRLSSLPGLRGICVAADGDDEAACEILDKSAWGSN